MQSTLVSGKGLYHNLYGMGCVLLGLIDLIEPHAVEITILNFHRLLKKYKLVAGGAGLQRLSLLPWFSLRQGDSHKELNKMSYNDNCSKPKKVPVTVIIPCYRCCETISRAVDSVLKQSKIPKEIILVDDFSEDGTLEKLSFIQKENPDIIKILALNENRGPGVARNLAWDQATQPYIAFLDSDDSWYSEKINIQYSWMISNQNIQLTGHLLSEDSERLPEPLKNNITTKKINPKDLLFVNRFVTSTVMLKKELPYRMGEKKYSEDYLLWLKIALSNKECQIIEVPLACRYKYAYGDIGLSADMWKFEKGELDTYFEVRKLRLISAITFSITITFSLIKFLRRLLIIKIRGGVKRITSH